MPQSRHHFTSMDLVRHVDGRVGRVLEHTVRDAEIQWRGSGDRDRVEQFSRNVAVDVPVNPEAFNNLQDKIEHLEERRHHLRERINDIKAHIEELESERWNKRQEIEDVKDQLESLYRDYAQMTGEFVDEIEIIAHNGRP